jgi:outer membrane protein assembly factor BamB
VTALDGYLYALDPTSGSVIPPYPYNSGAIDDQEDRLRASPVEAGESVVVASESGRVIAVKDAQTQWVWPSGTPDGSILTTPVVADGKVYVVLVNGQVQTLDAESGVPGWSFSPPEAK